MRIIQRLALAYREHNAPGGYDGSVDWPAAYACLTLILKELSQIPFVRELNYFGVSGSGALRRFGSWEELIASIPTWKKDIYRITQDPSDTGLRHVDVVLRGRYITVIVSTKGEDLEAVNKTAVPRLVRATMQIYPQIKDTFSLTEQAAIEVFNVPYPKPKPPRERPFLGFSKIVDYIDPIYYQEARENRREEVDVLLSVALPEGVKKMEQDGLVVLQWTDRLEDEATVAQHLHRRDQWLIEHLELPIEEGYNEQGDTMEAQVNLEVHPPLTFYSKTFRVGYKATALGPDGSVDADLLEDVTAWIAQNALPDGTPVRQVNLLVPDRQSAVNMLARARSIGVGKVLYVDNDGNWWDPDPPGR